MWSGAWNKRKFISEISNRFLPSSVSRALDWWSGGCQFKPHWGLFLTKFILCRVISDLSHNQTEMHIVKNSNVLLKFLIISLANFVVTYLYSGKFPSQTKAQTNPFLLFNHVWIEREYVLKAIDIAKDHRDDTDFTSFRLFLLSFKHVFPISAAEDTPQKSIMISTNRILYYTTTFVGALIGY